MAVCSVCSKLRLHFGHYFAVKTDQTVSNPLLSLTSKSIIYTSTSIGMPVFVFDVNMILWENESENENENLWNEILRYLGS